MFKYCALLIAAAGSAMPAEASDFQSRDAEFRPGMFVGARLRIPFNGSAARPASAALTLAPTATRTAADGSRQIRLGEGIAFGLTPRARAQLSIGGVPAGAAIGLRPAGEASNHAHKLGISPGGWAAIGTGVVAIAVAALVFRDKVDESSD